MLRIYLLLLLVVLQFQVSFADTCLPVIKPTKYTVLKGDHIAAILRTLQLEPVFGKNNSLDKLLKLNKILNQKAADLIEPRQELIVPFNCEEQVQVWKTQDRDKDRLLVRKKNSFTTVDEKVVTPISKPDKILETNVDDEQKKVETNAIAVQDTANSIIGSNVPTENIPRKNVEELGIENPTEVSEALRYRMICDGEWTGSQCVTRYSTLFLNVSGWYNRYDGVDPAVVQNNKGVLLSRLNPEAGAGWINYWTENIKTELSAAMQNSTILPETREVPIEQKKKYLGSFLAEIRYELSQWGIGLSYRQYDKQFYRFRFSGLSQPCLGGDSSFTGCGVIVSTASVGAMAIDLSYMLYQAGKFRYDMTAQYKKIGKASTGAYDVLDGSGMAIIFRVTHDRVKEYLYGELTYSVESQNTTIEKQSAQNLGFTFGYAWKLKDW